MALDAATRAYWAPVVDAKSTEAEARRIIERYRTKSSSQAESAPYGVHSSAESGGRLRGRKIIFLADAKRLGLKQYFTGKPCKHGHISPRQSGGGCMSCRKRHRQTPKSRAAACARMKRGWAGARASQLRRKGASITGAEVELIFDIHGGKCGMCQRVSIAKRRLYVDHNHKTGAVRGLLCHNCNLLIGFANDSLERLTRAAEYLIAHAR